MPCKNAMINFFNQTIESLKIMDFLKKTVIITGANRGTGRCIAENFIANGAEVFIHSLKEGDSWCPQIAHLREYHPEQRLRRQQPHLG